MEKWNDDVPSSEPNFPPRYNSMNDLDNPYQTLDTSNNAQQQPSNMISQNSHDHPTFESSHISDSSYISDFLMNETNENSYSLNPFPVRELPQQETPDFLANGTHENSYSSNTFPGRELSQQETPAFLGNGTHENSYSSNSFPVRDLPQQKAPGFLANGTHENNHSSNPIPGRELPQQQTPDFVVHGTHENSYSSNPFLVSVPQQGTPNFFLANHENSYSSNLFLATELPPQQGAPDFSMNETQENSYSQNPFPVRPQQETPDFSMNEAHENIYSSNNLRVRGLPQKGTSDWHLSSNLSNGNSLPISNFSSQTSISTGHPNQTAKHPFFNDSRKDDYSLNAILEPWRNGGGGGEGNGGRYYTTSSGNTMNPNIHANVHYENQDLLRNNKSYPFVDSLSSLNGGMARQSTPQPMKEAFSKNSTPLMQIGGISATTPYYSSGNNMSNAWMPIGEGNQRVSSTHPSSNSSLSYPNNSPFTFSNSTNYTSVPQRQGFRPIIGQTNTSLSNSNPPFGHNNWPMISPPMTSPLHGGTPSDRSEDVTRNLGKFSRPSAQAIRDANLSNIRSGGISKGSQTHQTNPLNSGASRDPLWWRKADPFSDPIFEQIFDKPIMEEMERKKKEEIANQKKNKSSSKGPGVPVGKEADTNPTPQPFLGDIAPQGATKGIVLREGAHRANDFGTGKATTSSVDPKGKAKAVESISSDDSD